MVITLVVVIALVALALSYVSNSVETSQVAENANALNEMLK
jgi:hypothetical protein